ncbi:hypothetical protein [uncultured Sphingomonas sp.]
MLQQAIQNRGFVVSHAGRNTVPIVQQEHRCVGMTTDSYSYGTLACEWYI